VSGALFLRSSGIHPNLSMTCERLLYVDHMRYVWSRTIRGVLVGFFPAGCTSIRIAVTLR
jgi:hypothetical protein